MPEFYLNIDYVGFNRVFLTGRTPEAEDFEIELDEELKRQLQDFQSVQQAALQKFLLKLVS